MTPKEHQQLIKAQIANSFRTEEIDCKHTTLEKGGKRATDGEIRNWSGVKMVKHSDGWVKVDQSGKGRHTIELPGGKVVPAEQHHVDHAQTHLDRHEREQNQLSPSAEKHKKAMDEGATEEEANSIANGKRHPDDHSGKNSREKDIESMYLTNHLKDNTIMMNDGVHRHTSDNGTERYSTPDETKSDFHDRIRHDVKVDNENDKKLRNENIPKEVKELENLGVKFSIGKKVHQPIEKVHLPVDRDDSVYSRINDVLDRYNLSHLKQSTKPDVYHGDKPGDSKWPVD